MKRRLTLFLLPLFSLIGCSAGSDELVAHEVEVEFTGDYSEADVQEVTAFLQEFDPNGDFQLQESFPPTLRGMMTVDEPDFCQTVQGELSARPKVASVRCFGFGRLYSPDEPSRALRDCTNPIATSRPHSF